ncbi:unnamed protein product [Paramecium octaurelia]|uniref:Uncharacterized protein n=1 Tax=Paramecium octaurelia TaxID=43137 RepID=A0A8S1V0M8_PAROT|nr:unnamed protein product [Paramecium octaurelia]
MNNNINYTTKIAYSLHENIEIYISYSISCQINGINSSIKQFYITYFENIESQLSEESVQLFISKQALLNQVLFTENCNFAAKLIQIDKANRKQQGHELFYTLRLILRKRVIKEALKRGLYQIKLIGKEEICRYACLKVE